MPIRRIRFARKRVLHLHTWPALFSLSLFPPWRPHPELPSGHRFRFLHGLPSRNDSAAKSETKTTQHRAASFCRSTSLIANTILPSIGKYGGGYICSQSAPSRPFRRRKEEEPRRGRARIPGCLLRGFHISTSSAQPQPLSPNKPRRAKRRLNCNLTSVLVSFRRSG
ncbi:hypothetical protein VTI28DRAFT_3912 [Corynascus sepedonium]